MGLGSFRVVPAPRRGGAPGSLRLGVRAAAPTLRWLGQHDPGVREESTPTGTIDDRHPNELAADIMEKGIVLTGGGALLQGLGARLQEETGMLIVLASDPLSCVAIGAGQCLEEFAILKEVLVTSG